MVYQDWTNSQIENQNQFPLASLADRMLAFFIDLVLFAPVFSIVLAKLFQKLEILYYVSRNSIEFLILLLVSGLFIGFLTILFQTLFLLILGATPGKYFLKMRVISAEDPEKPLRFSQALLRSFLWVLECLCLFFPFLEILSEVRRRPLHDRAAGTIVVTLKASGDSGPHHIETQFIRQFLLMMGLGVFTISIFSAGNLYRLAVRGDFKKSELESENYLCATVGDNLEAGEIRLDKSLAMFLADEISEECLSAEADFVLWTTEETEKPWAYLAKGMLKKQDTAQFEAYLNKVCDLNEESEACDVAKFQADPENHLLNNTSLTAAVLKVTSDFEKGLYAQAEKSFLEMAQRSGLETFAQQGLVKAYWAQNKIERAKGAYHNVVHQMDQDHSLELSAWICHEELDRSCTQEAIDACEDVKNRTKDSKSFSSETFVAVALIREKECRQSASVSLSNFESLFREKKDVYRFAQAISKDNPLTNDQRALILQDLALRKEPVRPMFLRRLALLEWLDYADSNEEFQKISRFLKDKKNRDLSWVKIYEKSLKTFIHWKAEKALAEIVDLPSAEIIQTYQLQTAQIQGQYLAGNFEKAQNELARYSSSSRAPASANGEELSLTRIRQELQRKLKGKGLEP